MPAAGPFAEQRRKGTAPAPCVLAVFCLDLIEGMERGVHFVRLSKNMTLVDMRTKFAYGDAEKAHATRKIDNLCKEFPCAFRNFKTVFKRLLQEAIGTEAGKVAVTDVDAYAQTDKALSPQAPCNLVGKCKKIFIDVIGVRRSEGKV